jgi:NADH-quinone oxidoreductase subunit J
VTTTNRPWQPNIGEENFGWGGAIATVDTIKRIGEVFYTEFWTLFELAGVLLLIGMIGAIRLTLSHQYEIKRQDLKTQIYDARASVWLRS